MYSSNFLCRFWIYKPFYTKNILYRFFFHLKLQNFEIVGLFIHQGLCPECILLKNANVIDVGRGLRQKIRHPPPLRSQSPSLPPPPPVPGTSSPPPQRHLAPTVQGQWCRVFLIMWPPRPMAVAPLLHSRGNPYCRKNSSNRYYFITSILTFYLT